jgi:hypothetical protein
MVNCRRFACGGRELSGIAKVGLARARARTAPENSYLNVAWEVDRRQLVPGQHDDQVTMNHLPRARRRDQAAI